MTQNFPATADAAPDDPAHRAAQGPRRRTVDRARLRHPGGGGSPPRRHQARRPQPPRRPAHQHHVPSRQDDGVARLSARRCATTRPIRIGRPLFTLAASAFDEVELVAHRHARSCERLSAETEESSHFAVALRRRHRHARAHRRQRRLPARRSRRRDAARPLHGARQDPSCGARRRAAATPIWPAARRWRSPPRRSPISS